YHFARGGDAIKEADHFVNTVGELRYGEIVVLDYELYSIKNPASWCLSWLRRVEERLGFKPLFYTYHAILKTYNWKAVSDNGYPLWAARYGLQQQTPNPKYYPDSGSWPRELIWQYCSKGIVPGIIGDVDLDSCDTIITTLKTYGKKEKPELSCLHCPIHCPN
ncbi:MAG: glycoside hydrolase family 25 protein, partial [Bacilli bacterium]